MTLKYVSADFALSQFARALGDEADSALLLRHAQNWANHFNPQSGYLEMRRRGRFLGARVPSPVLKGMTAIRLMWKGTAAQYVWMVPFNLKTLFDLMGGPQAAATRLDQFFTGLNAGAEFRLCVPGQ